MMIQDSNKVIIIIIILAWDLRLKWLKIWQLAHIFAHCAVEKRLEHFSMASRPYSGPEPEAGTEMILGQTMEI